MTINILNYSQAKPYIKAAKKLLKGIKSLRSYVKENTKDNCESPNDDLEIKNILQAKRNLETLENALLSIKDEEYREILDYIIIESHTLLESADYFNYSQSSLWRKKELALARIAEILFGIMIDTSCESLSKKIAG